ncbi:hypothetical protein ACH4E7_42845 [Kitasatospora sp. NPDC018058]|uniref:hypothetical protein n=1 Tax=Kitasatospora sp. NPDC018058 TaxID=3364025 RepID=UPI0037BE3A74
MPNTLDPDLPQTFRIERISADLHHGIALDDHGHPEYTLVAVALRHDTGWHVIDTIGSVTGLADEQEALACLAEVTAERLGSSSINDGRHLDVDGMCLCANRCCMPGWDAEGRAGWR